MRKVLLVILITGFACCVNAEIRWEPEPDYSNNKTQIFSMPSGAQIEISALDRWGNDIGGDAIGQTPMKVVIRKNKPSSLIKDAVGWWVNDNYYPNGFRVNAIPNKKGDITHSKIYKGDIPVPKKIFFNLSIQLKKILD